MRWYGDCMNTLCRAVHTGPVQARDLRLTFVPHASCFQDHVLGQLRLPAALLALPAVLAHMAWWRSFSACALGNSQSQKRPCYLFPCPLPDVGFGWCMAGSRCFMCRLWQLFSYFRAYCPLFSSRSRSLYLLLPSLPWACGLFEVWGPLQQRSLRITSKQMEVACTISHSVVISIKTSG